MTRVIMHRVLISIPVLFLVSILTFVLVSLLPGSAAQSLLGEQATPDQVARVRAQLGLDLSVPEQYWNWLKTVAQGSLGNSILNGAPVTETLNVRLPVTLTLVIGTTLVSAVIGITLGVLSALRGGVLGRIIDIFTFTGLALPSFFIGLALIAIFAVTLQIFPPNGYVTFGTSPADWARSLVLPIAAMAVHGLSSVATQTRDATLDALNKDFVRVQFANGISRRSIVWQHVLRNAAPPIATMVGLVFVGLLSGAVLIESIFALPGLGQAVVSAATHHDIPVVQGAVLYFTVLVVIVNLIIDLVYSWVDPRVRVR